MCPSDKQRTLPSAAMPGLRDAFSVLDADGDGRIGEHDLRAFYTGFSGCCSGAVVDDEIRSMIASADRNQNGFVELEEFELVLGARQIEWIGGEALRDAFRIMDRDRDGVIGFSDLKEYMGRAGFPASDGDLRTMLRTGGGDETKGVSYDAFLKIMAMDLSGLTLGGLF